MAITRSISKKVAVEMTKVRKNPKSINKEIIKTKREIQQLKIAIEKIKKGELTDEEYYKLKEKI